MGTSSNNTKQCPYCGEDININAVKCPCCRSWLDGRDATIQVPQPVSKKPATPAAASSPSSLEEFLDRVAGHVTHAKRLQNLCITAMVFSVYSYLTSCVSSDEYYRSGFLNGLAKLDEHIGWLMSLLENIVSLCLLLALRMVLKRHGIKSWISLCIVAWIIALIFSLITSNSFICVIPCVASALLMIEFGYKMYRSPISHIKNVGLLDMINSSLLIAFLFLLLPWAFIALFNEGEESGYYCFMVLCCAIDIAYLVLLKKLFKIEYPEKQ